MSINVAPTSNDTSLEQLMHDVSNGKIQLPDFQRGWTWDDDRIRGILASLTQGYPMGAIMHLGYGSESVRFKYRTIEGVKAENVVPEFLDSVYMRLRQNSQPNSDTPDMNSRKER